MNRRTGLLAISICVAALVTPTTAVQAAPLPAQTTSATTVDDGAYYATPAELSALGFDQAAITKQTKLIAAMPKSDKRVQDARRASQPQPSVSARALVTPNSVGSRPCDEQAVNDYKTWFKDANGNHPDCFNGSGTVTLGYDLRATSLQANSETGRVLYSYQCGECQTYWSTWRGPNDKKMYAFETIVGPAHIYRVQLK